MQRVIGVTRIGEQIFELGEGLDVLYRRCGRDDGCAGTLPAPHQAAFDQEAERFAHRVTASRKLFAKIRLCGQQRGDRINTADDAFLQFRGNVDIKRRLPDAILFG